MTVVAVIGFLTALAPLIVAILEAVSGHRARIREAHEQLADHSVSELHIATDGVQPVPDPDPTVRPD